MNRIKAAAVVCAVVVVLTAVGSWYVDSTFRSLSQQLTQAEALSREGEYEKAGGVYRRLVQEWEAREKLLGLFLKHDILSELSGMLRETAAYNHPDYQTELKSETARTLDRIRTAGALFFSVC